MKLLECLTFQTWRTLQAISRATGLGFDANWTKQQAAQRLADWLGSDEHLRSLADLPAEAHAALGELLAAGGQMDYDTFTAHFGPIRPYRPWKKTVPPSPWTEPQSVAEALFYRGLVFPVPVGRGRHRHRAMALPDDFHEAVRRDARPCASTATPHPSLDALPAPSLPFDLLTFLGYLQREEVRPLWGRWLPPRVLRALKWLMICPDDLGDVRSERQARYIAFLHYLAEAAGLVAPLAGYLKPTLEAHRWLEQPPAERITMLWNAWRLGRGTACCAPDDNEARWRAFRLPGWSAPGPLERFHRLCQALAHFPPGHTLPAEAWPLALGEVDPSLLRPTPVYSDWHNLDAVAQSEWKETLQAALGNLVTGPLTWFGVFRMANQQSSPCPLVSLSPLGAALVGREDGEWPVIPPPHPLRIAPLPEDVEGAPAISSIAPPGLSWTGRFALEELAAPQGGAPGQYVLTRAGLLRALRRGHTVPGIIALLEELSGEPLPPAIFTLLDEWGAAYGEVTIRPVTLLQVREPELLQRLARRRRLRRFFGETFSERAVAVDSSRIPQLLRALERRGLMPRVEAGLTDMPEGILSGEHSPQSKDAESDPPPAERAFIVAALQLFTALGESLPDAPPLPYALLERWEQSLTAAEKDAAGRAVQAVLDGLRRAGQPAVRRPHLPTPAGPLLERLEQAIAAGKAVTITYYTASRDHLNTRRISPLRLEWRGQTAYCIAYCHLREAERVFRVDRIREIR